MTLQWDAPELKFASDSQRTARYRLLQSWYRESVLNVEPGLYKPKGGEIRLLGSRLHSDDVVAHPALNFLGDERIAAYARQRAEEVRSTDGSLEFNRLRTNLLSSMPLCFNLFGMLAVHPELALDIIRPMFDPDAIAVETIECEWKPDGALLADRTAFDAVIFTRRADGGTHLIGVETKYTESFSPKEYPVDRYRSVHERSGWFKPEAADALAGRATNQLWRNTLLAAACELEGIATSASLVVVAMADDQGADKALAGVRRALVDPDRCRLVSLESIVATAKKNVGLRDWADRFEQRYLDLTPLDVAR